MPIQTREQIIIPSAFKPFMLFLIIWGASFLKECKLPSQSELIPACQYLPEKIVQTLKTWKNIEPWLTQIISWL